MTDVDTTPDTSPQAEEGAPSRRARFHPLTVSSVRHLTDKAIEVTFAVPEELAIAPGGYARSLDGSWLEKERQLIAQHLADVDVVILSALVPGEVAPILITDDMVAMMKPGAVIIDVSVDQGGNCAATEAGAFCERHGVEICGIQNIPGRMAVHASWLYAQNMCHFIENLFKKGHGVLDLDDEIVRSTLVTHQGKVVHEGTLKAMG